jgi:uncharacterized protein (DUF1330 family)
VADHGGEMVIGSTGRHEYVEGEASQPGLIVARFPSYEQMLEWYHSDAYQPLIAMRQRAATGTVSLHEGF